MTSLPFYARDLKKNAIKNIDKEYNFFSQNFYLRIKLKLRFVFKF